MTTEPNSPDCGPEVLARYLGDAPVFERVRPEPKVTAQDALDATYAAIIRVVELAPHPAGGVGPELSALAHLVAVLAHQAAQEAAAA